MKEKIRKLAKGIERIDTPALRLAPDSLEGQIPAGASSSFILGVMSDNGIIVKGVLTSDDQRVVPEPSVFAGRANYITVNVSAAGLEEGALIEGFLSLLTEAGEYHVPYHIGIGPAGGEEEKKETVENPLLFDVFLTPEEPQSVSFPEEEDVFCELIGELILSRDYSPYAYLAYKEAIKRGININGLCESFVLSYPIGAGQEIPREVVLYFYFDSDIPSEIAERLFASVLSFEEPDSETVLSLAPRMSAFALSNAVSLRINERLAVIYDHMIHADILDERAAKKLPDILRCERIRLTKGEADYLILSYPDLKTELKSVIKDSEAFLPVYSLSASLSFFDAEGSKLSGIEYSMEALFDRTDLLLRCFELCPEQGMLVYCAVKEIIKRGIRTPDDREVLVRGLKDPSYAPGLRNAIICALSADRGELDWIRYLRDEDFCPKTLPFLFSAFMAAKDYESAYRLVLSFGTEFADTSGLRKLMEQILSKRGEKLAGDQDFTRMAIGLFKRGQAGARLTEYLTAHYIGSIFEMLKLMDEAAKKRLNLSILPENILSFMLFSGTSERIDDVFCAYLGSPDRDELLMDAYFAIRSADYFLYEQAVDEDLIFPLLSRRVLSLMDPLGYSRVSLIALSAYYSGRDSLSDDEALLLKLITDKLIGEGYVFRYMKRLRRFIEIPEEVAFKYYIEYHAPRGSMDTPKLMMRVLPDETDMHEEEMKRVFRGVFVAETILLTGDKLEYHIYPSYRAEEPVREGVISAAREQKESNVRMKELNAVIRALNAGDLNKAKESMLGYALKAEAARILFDPGDM